MPEKQGVLTFDLGGVDFGLQAFLTTFLKEDIVSKSKDEPGSDQGDAEALSCARTLSRGMAPRVQVLGVCEDVQGGEKRSHASRSPRDIQARVGVLCEVPSLISNGIQTPAWPSDVRAVGFKIS